MNNRSKFDHKRWNIRADGEPYRRLHIYITIVDGLVHSVETCEPSEAVDPEAMPDLACYLDTFRNGMSCITFAAESRFGALEDFLEQFDSLRPVEKGSTTFVFDDAYQMLQFQIICGG